MELLRKRLGIDKWVVFGGSWGSTLALAYAEHHPERCLGLVLRGIFLCRQSEIDWFLYGVRHIFPEAWQTFSGFVPASDPRYVVVVVLDRPESRLLGTIPARATFKNIALDALRDARSRPDRP